MKNKFNFCLSFFTAAVFSLPFLSSGCKKESRDEDPKELAQDKNDAKFEDTKEADARFLVDVAGFNLEQAELGKLISLKSNNAEVKGFGRMMRDMYGQKTKDVNAFAASKQISVPRTLTAENKDDYNALNKKDIDDLDKDYIDKVVKRHTDAIEDYTDEMNKTSDADLKKWLMMELTSLREHLDGAMTLQSKLKNK